MAASDSRRQPRSTRYYVLQQDGRWTVVVVVLLAETYRCELRYIFRRAQNSVPTPNIYHGIAKDESNGILLLRLSRTENYRKSMKNKEQKQPNPTEPKPNDRPPLHMSLRNQGKRKQIPFTTIWLTINPGSDTWSRFLPHQD